MSPAFSSTRQAVGFAILLLVLFLLPALVGKNTLPPRSEIYSSIGWRMGPFPYIHKKIYKETGDVDIAFLGSSHLMSGIDTTYVQKELSHHLGRDAKVFTLGWPYAGFDAVYFILRDLLDHRNVKMVVLNEEYRRKYDTPHNISYRWFRWGDDAYTLDEAPVQSKIALYAGSILGMPHNLVSLLRPNLEVIKDTSSGNYWETFYQALPFSETLGALTARIGYNYDPNFVVYKPGNHLQPLSSFVFSEASKDSFQFTGPATPPYQLHYARKIAGLARDHGVKLVMLHMPDISETGDSVPEREFWPSVLQTPIDIVGVPPDKFTEGIKQEDLAKLFYDGGHLSANGQKYFTPLITPALLHIYDSKTTPH